MSFENKKGTADADYVAAWFAKAANYGFGKNVRAAFVATNSIGQGQQPGIIWLYLWDKGAKIDFAYQPFLWNSEASGKAAAAVTAVGFSSEGKAKKAYFEMDYKTGDVPTSQLVDNIGPYLKPGSNQFVANRPKPLCPFGFSSCAGVQAGALCGVWFLPTASRANAPFRKTSS